MLYDAPTPAVAPIEIAPTDAWMARIRRTFEDPDLPTPTVATAPPADDDFLIAIPPDSPLAEVHHVRATA
jgi:hypothetical protein